MRKLLLTLAALAGVFMYACQETDVNGPSGGDNGDGGTYVGDGFKLSLSIPGTRANAYTTIEPVRTESDIYSLHLVFFERTSDASGAYKGFYSVDIDENSPLDVSYPIDVRFEESSGLTNTEAYNILLVANLDWFLRGMTIDQWKSYLPSMTERMARDLTRAYVSGEPDETVYSDGLDRLPMSVSTYKEPLVSRVQVILDRTVARIDLMSYLGATYDMVSASIWNGFPYSSVWQGEVDYSDARIQRYYGVLTEPSSNGQYNNIEGGLYTFENYVESPEANDRLTTCMIIGMRSLDPSSPSYNITLYYRINIHSAGSPQDIKRNSSYNLTIRGVLDRGYPTELEAYLGETDKLDVVINYWDLDDDGIIQYDGDNVLAVPMKRINIPREGDEREYSIFTLGKGTLALTRNTTPAGINVRLDGNMLYVDSDPLPGNLTSRSGEIDLTFGTLKATVYINQSGDQTGSYLELLPGTLGLFPAYGTTTSETVKVEASGAWTAKIYNEGFTFVAGSNVTEITSAQGNSFSISTTGSNPDNTSRVGFVVVSLNDNASVNRSLVLQQRGQSGLTVTPKQEYVQFTPEGVPAAGNTNTFTVDPGDNGYGVINPWQVQLEDETNFYISSYKYDPYNVSGNTFTVSAKRENIGRAQLYTYMKVYIVDEPTVSFRIPVVQLAYYMSVSPTSFNTVPAAGGRVGPATVTGTQGKTWTATVTTTTDGIGHSATLTDSQGNGSTTKTGTTGQSFYITFPRVTTPNISPVATVTVRLDGTELVQTFTVNQTSLVPRKLRFNSKGTGQGTLMPGYSGYSYINVLGENLYNSSNFGTLSNSVVKTSAPIEKTYGYSKTLSSDITNFHANQACGSYNSSVIEWLGRDHRNFLTVCIDDPCSDHQKLLRMLSSSYTVASGKVKTGVVRSLSQTPQTYRNNKVWEYLTKTGPFTDGVEINVNNTFFYNGDATNGCLTSWPSTTIPIIMNPSVSGAVQLAVDPVHKVIIIGDTEMFCRRNTASNKNDFTQGSDNWKFLNNLIAFMVNAGMYGDNFLDEFR